MPERSFLSSLLACCLLSASVNREANTQNVSYFSEISKVATCQEAQSSVLDDLRRRKAYVAYQGPRGRLHQPRMPHLDQKYIEQVYIGGPEGRRDTLMIFLAGEMDYLYKSIEFENKPA